MYSWLAPVGLLAPLLLGIQAPVANHPVLGASIFCDTAEDMGQYIHAAEAGDADRILSSTDRPRPSCAAAAANYHEHEQVRVIQDGIRSFRIMRVTVVGVYRNGALINIEPRDQYLAIREEGMEV
jgi:hypothetical protein